MFAEHPFSVRMTSKDWAGDQGAWRCSALDLPNTQLVGVTDQDGLSIALDNFRFERGPARLKWLGREREQPTQILASIVQKESAVVMPANKSGHWSKVRILVPVITAVISAVATYSIAVVNNGNVPKSPIVADRMLRMSVKPSDLAGLPRPALVLNGAEQPHPAQYKMTEDARVDVDMSNVVVSWKAQKEAAASANALIAKALSGVNGMYAFIMDKPCSGGSSGVPIVNQRPVVETTQAIRNYLSEAQKGLTR